MECGQAVYYVSKTIILDDILAVSGLVLALAALLFLELLPVIAVLLFGFACLCCYFVVDVARKHCLRLHTTSVGLVVEHANCYHSWDELKSFSLAYYATRKDAQHGWMEVLITIGKRRLRIDSRAVGFASLVQNAATAAARLGLSLSPTTVRNISIVIA